MSKTAVSAIILAGGQSKRMGEDKRLVKLQSVELINIAISLAEGFSDDILISSNDSAAEFKSYQICPDIQQGSGPLNGVLSALPYIKHNSAIVLTTDMPLLTKSLIELLIKYQNKNIITVFQQGEYLHPFPGLYPSGCCNQISTIFNEGIRSMHKAFDMLPINVIELSEDQFKNHFLNINHKEDLKRAHNILRDQNESNKNNI